MSDQGNSSPLARAERSKVGWTLSVHPLSGLAGGGAFTRALGRGTASRAPGRVVVAKPVCTSRAISVVKAAGPAGLPPIAGAAPRARYRSGLCRSPTRSDLARACDACRKVRGELSSPMPTRLRSRWSPRPDSQNQFAWSAEKCNLHALHGSGLPVQ
jgi:hypothetical protein